MKSSRALAPLLTLALVSACSDSGGGGVDAPGGDPDGGGDVDAAIPAGYTRLIGRTWTLPGGQPDTYKCVRVTLPQEVTVSEIMAQAPFGTHHTVLSIASGSAAGPDGETDCSVQTLGMVMLYASGVGTSPLVFPADVGLRIPAGTQIHLNLHLFNSSDQPLSGDSAILVKSPPSTPTQFAENVFAGTFRIAVPPGQTVTVAGSCTAQRDYTIFALWPHMHQIATHQKVEILRGGTPTTLLDRDFHFAEQNYYLQDPQVQVRVGDQIRVSCTYNNTTSTTVTFGDSSNQEMCFSGLYRYPAAGGGNIFECSGN